jgi:RecA/RadA recombinase
MLGGGLHAGDFNLVYGEATSGKTTLALTVTTNHLRAYRAAKAVIIDSDNKLNMKRLQQIAARAPDTLMRIHIHTPNTFKDQAYALEKLPDLHRTDLFIVDSVTGLYRTETETEEQTYRSNKELNRQLGYITEVAKTTGATAIITGQVRSVLDTYSIEPVAPRLLSHWSSTIIKLEKTNRPNQRQATVEKPKTNPSTIYLTVNENGMMEAQP